MVGCAHPIADQVKITFFLERKLCLFGHGNSVTPLMHHQSNLQAGRESLVPGFRRLGEGGRDRTEE